MYMTENKYIYPGEFLTAASSAKADFSADSIGFKSALTNDCNNCNTIY